MASKLTDSVQRAFAILNAFTVTSPRMTLQQLAGKVGLPKGTAFRYLHTLTSLGYLSHYEDSRYYMLTPKVLSLGFTVLGNTELREVAFPYLEELSRVSNQTVNLGIIDGTEVVYIERIKRRCLFNVDYGIGSRLNLYRTSIGCGILAFMSDVEIQNVCKKLLEDLEAQKFMGADGSKLLSALAKVRKKGYALNNEAYLSGLRGIAAPVFDGRGIVEGAINMPVFSAEVSLDQLIRQYVPLLLETAQKISAMRGFVQNKGPLNLTVTGR